VRREEVRQAGDSRSRLGRSRGRRLSHRGHAPTAVTAICGESMRIAETGRFGECASITSMVSPGRWSRRVLSSMTARVGTLALDVLCVP
jgi:hypothetical protein